MLDVNLSVLVLRSIHHIILLVELSEYFCIIRQTTYGTGQFSNCFESQHNFTRVSVQCMLFFEYCGPCTTNLNREGINFLYKQFIDIKNNRVILLTTLCNYRLLMVIN